MALEAVRWIGTRVESLESSSAAAGGIVFKVNESYSTPRGDQEEEEEEAETTSAPKDAAKHKPIDTPDAMEIGC